MEKGTPSKADKKDKDQQNTVNAPKSTSRAKLQHTRDVTEFDILDLVRERSRDIPTDSLAKLKEKEKAARAPQAPGEEQNDKDSKKHQLKEESNTAKKATTGVASKNHHAKEANINAGSKAGSNNASAKRMAHEVAKQEKEKATIAGKEGSPHGESFVANPPDLERGDDIMDIMDIVRKRATLANSEDESSNEDEPIVPQPPEPISQPSEATLPGAYNGALGECPRYQNKVRFSVFRRSNQPRNKEVLQKNTQKNDNSSELSWLQRSLSILSRASFLVEAKLVEEESIRPEMQAELFDPEAAEQKKTEGWRKQKKYFLLIAVILLFVVAAIVLGVILREEKAIGNAPTEPPTAPPSSAPTGPLESFIEGLPEYTKESLESVSNPQWQAMDWLSLHPDLLEMPEWRKAQLFALVTFYFAMDGPNWQEGIKRTWLRYDIHECLWFSSIYGYINEQGLYMKDETWAEDSYENLGFGDSCNEEDHFDALALDYLNQPTQDVSIPPEITLLTALSALSLYFYPFNASISELLPSQIYEMQNLTFLSLLVNGLTGSVPSELGLLTSLTVLHLGDNEFAGSIPTEVGNLTNLIELDLQYNALTGAIPTQLGLLTSTTLLHLFRNELNSTIPTELGRMTNMAALGLQNNELTGFIPSQLGSMTGMTLLRIRANRLSGSIPSELGRATSLKIAYLETNALTGTIPHDFALLAVNGSLEILALTDNNFSGTIRDPIFTEYSPLTALYLANNSFSGTVPESLCGLGMYGSGIWPGFSFDCNDQLCGCCWCPCPGSNHSITDCETDQSDRDKDFPGSFPAPINRSNAITINVRTDRWPRDTSIEWSLLGGNASWELLDTENPLVANNLTSYTKTVQSNGLYRLRLLDSFGDGTCCETGLGWFSVTNSTPSLDQDEGSLVWKTGGYQFEGSLDVFFWTDSNGQAQQVQYISGQGYALVREDQAIVVVSESGSNPTR